MAIDVRDIESEVLRGLQNEQGHLDEARTNLQVYHGTFVDPELYYYDPANRARRDIPIMSKVIDSLTGYAYQDPPTRKVGDDVAATEYLEEVYKQAKANSKIRATDRHRHAANYAAIQVHATGDETNPIRLINWTADSHVVWCDDEDQTEPVACCTIDRYDNRTRYRLWTADECRTYLTKKLMPGQTAGGRVPQLVGIDPNPYGVLPFVFAHFSEPVTQFDEGGIGTTLSRLERMLNFRFMESADHLRHSKPHGFLMGLEADKSLMIRPRAGEFERFGPKVPTNVADDKGGNPEVQWIGPPLEWVEAEWSDIRYHWNYMLECVGVPSASIPVDKAIIATVSGAALIAQNIPLFLYARKTQELYRGYEEQLARLVFVVSNAVYGGWDDVLKDFTLAVEFGEVVPDMPPDSPDDYLDGLADRGELSEVQVVMKRQGLSREEAIAHLEQVYKDQQEIQQLKKKYGVDQVSTSEPLESVNDAEKKV